MEKRVIVTPDFLIIGAQKAATTWLWKLLDCHPGTDLPQKKEIHFFGGVENYRRGPKWYYTHFSELDPSKVIGEASTSYFYDRIPYWYNPSSSLEVDCSLPTMPELVTNELPSIKIIVLLRDPVWRAVSAYKHYMRRLEKGKISIRLGLRKTAIQRPKLRILEYGYYAHYLKLWKKFVPPERMLILIYEEDVIKAPEQTARKTYSFLNLNSQFRPLVPNARVHKSWTWTRIMMQYYAPAPFKKLIRGKGGDMLDRFDFLKSFAIRKDDIEFLRSAYLQGRQELEAILGRDLSCWNYGLQVK